MMNEDLKLVECPRDAMQGWKSFIPTEKKIAYINSLLRVGFDTIDFGSYVSPKAIPQMADTPEIHVHVIATDNPPGGIGEVGLPPTSGAIGNAVAALTGARVRHLPMIPERVLAALRSA